jgi:serine protease Do
MTASRIAILSVLLASLVSLGQPLAADGETGWLGVSVGRAAPDSAEDGRGGIVVTGIVNGSAAEKAGLRARDRILTLNGASVTSFADFREVLSAAAPGSWISLAIERDDDDLTLNARLTGQPSKENMRIRAGWIGIEVIDLPAALREHFGAPRDSGVMVSNVVAGSPAESAGIELGDVVYQIHGDAVRSTGAIAQGVIRGGVGNTVEMTLVRLGAEIVVEAQIEIEPPKVDEPEKTS